jgi:hypothetical protein
MSTLPMETLSSRASEQREQLHRTASDLRDKIHETREELSLNGQLRRHLLPVSLIASFVALGLGYNVAGWFTRE